MKKALSFLISFALLCTMCFGMGIAASAAETEDTWENHAADAFAGGSGTEKDPYRIETAQQLAKLEKDVNVNRNYYPDTFFILTENIDLSAYRWTPIGIYANMGSSTRFSGHLDGGNHRITGLMVDESQSGNSAGLFGCIGWTSASTQSPSVKNLVISDASIQASDASENTNVSGYSAILVGCVYYYRGSTLVENVRVSGTIVNKNVNDYPVHSGGLAGEATGLVAKNCSADVGISGGITAVSGGFVGFASGGSYTNCKSSGSIAGEWALGGFAGEVSDNAEDSAVFTRCQTDVNITGGDWNLGGFTGYIGSTWNDKPCHFMDCVAKGDITSTVTGWEPKAGGFVGTNRGGSIENCYYSGTITTGHETVKPSGFAANAVGGLILDCKYDADKNPGLEAVSSVDGEPGSNTVSGLHTADIADKIIKLLGDTINEADGFAASNVYADYVPGAAAEPVYQVDVSWGSLKFTYTGASEGIWNPQTHQFENQTEGGWSCEEGADQITVINHSNAPVNAALSYTSGADFADVTGGFAEASGTENDGILSLATAVGTDASAAPTATASLALTGALSSDTAANSTIGAVTVTLADAQ